MIQRVFKDTDIQIIESIAHKTWNAHYVPIIGQNQVDYMLEKLQNFDAISSQIKNGHEYYLISTTKKAVGYLCLISDNEKKKIMISKIYIEKSATGSGLGTEFINFTKNLAKEKGMKKIWLTVNKNNSDTIQWYKNLQFKITKEVKMDIGNDFIMDDFVMELKLI